jgi:hypothetical protein
LELRKVEVSSLDATKSVEALITYINQNPCGKWVINNYAYKMSRPNVQKILYKNVQLI